MKSRDEERILRILVEQGLLSDRQVEAYLTYQEGTERRTGERLPLHQVMEKLEILSREQISSLLKALEMTPPPASRPPMAAVSSGSSVDSTLENMRGDKAPKIAPWPRRATKSDDEEASKPEGIPPLVPSKLAPPPALAEAKAALGLDKPSLGSLDKGGDKSASPSLLRPSLQEAANAAESGTASSRPRHRLGQEAAAPSDKANVAPPPPVEPETEPAKKSLFLGYILLLSTGVLGGHRFYLRSYTSAFWYLFTFGFLGIGVILDLFLLPIITKRVNNEMFAGLNVSIWKQLRNYDGCQYSESLPAWVQKDTALQAIGGFFETLLRLVYALIAPVLLGILAIIVWQPLIPIILIVWLTLFLANFRTNQALTNTPALRHVPFLALLNQKITQFTGFYFYNKPGTILFYLFYPLWLPLGVILGEKRRQEAATILWLLVLGAGLILANFLCNAWMVSFQNNLPAQHLILFNLVFGLVVIWLFLMLAMPLWISLATMRLKQQHAATGIFGGWAWIVQVVILVVMMLGSVQSFNFAPYSEQQASRQIITKLQLPEYRNLANAMIQEFVASTQQDTQANFNSELAAEYTKQVRIRLAGSFPARTALALHVRYLENHSAMVLFAASYPLIVWDKQQTFTKWDDLVKKQYEASVATSYKNNLAWQVLEDWLQYSANISFLQENLFHHECQQKMLDDILVVEKTTDSK